MTGKRPQEFSGLQRIQGRAVAQGESDVDRLANEYAVFPEPWGQFVFPMCDGHGALYTRTLVIDSGGNPIIIGAGDLSSDDIATTEIGQNSRSFLWGFDGATWDRIRSGANNADAQAAIALGNLQVLSFGMGFNGTTFDRIRLASAANVGAAADGVQLVTGPNQWTETDSPAANTAATATRAAQGAGTRSIVQWIEVTLAVGATASIIVEATLTANGAIRWRGKLSAVIGDSKRLSISGLNIETADNGTAVLTIAAAGLTTEVTAAMGGIAVT